MQMSRGTTDISTVTTPLDSLRNRRANALGPASTAARTGTVPLSGTLLRPTTALAPPAAAFAALRSAFATGPAPHERGAVQFERLA